MQPTAHKPSIIVTNINQMICLKNLNLDILNWIVNIWTYIMKNRSSNLIQKFNPKSNEKTMFLSVLKMTVI